METNVEVLRQILVAPGHLSAEALAAAEAESRLERRPLADFLVDRGLIRDEQLGQLLADHFGFDFLNLRREKIDPQIFNLIPESVARAEGVVAITRTPAGVRVGMLDPTKFDLLQNLSRRLGDAIIPFLVTRRGLLDSFNQYRQGLREELTQVVKRLSAEEVPETERQNMVVRLVHLILHQAYQQRASDIHFEPQRTRLLVRFRIDGVLHDAFDLPAVLREPLLSRLKILARLRLDEHQSAQDGRFSFETSGERVDVRVSLVPVTQGENLVLRLLAENSRQFSLTELGLGETDLVRVRRAIDNPHGMILVTGPTGSGKTTTVYAVIKILNRRDVHISTIEDPVEYEISGVSQIQVNPKTNLTFAQGLRSILRQDPDVIVVGEIRDEETAGIAINSAMTGHLVLSTVHANDAATTLPRLLDMGIEPFLVASTVNVVLAQRLVRKICERCRVSSEPTVADRRLIEEDETIRRSLRRRGYRRLNDLTLYRGLGCRTCGETGFVGRLGIFEVLEITDKIKKLIVARAASHEILAAAAAEGMTTMLEDGLGKVITGETTLAEVLRVIKL